MSACRVLVVDDDFDIRETLSEVLSDEGYQVATAADGLDAITWLRHNAAPDVILLDLMMPRCDGTQFRAEQRADPKLEAIPVVLLSADLRIHDKTRELGAQAALAKPVRLDDLLAVLERFKR